MTAAERARSAKRVARIATLPAAAGLLASLKGLAAAAGIGAGSALVAIGAFTLVEARIESASAPAAPPGVQAPVLSTSPAGETASPAESPSSEPAPAKSAPAIPDGPPTAMASGSAPRRVDAAPPGAAPALPSSEPAAAMASASAIASAAPDVDPLVREALLLDQAQRLLASDPGEALVRLGEHARQFPAGKLGLERELFTIDALRRLGRGAEARARGEALLARSIGGPYEARVRQMVEGQH